MIPVDSMEGQNTETDTDFHLDCEKDNLVNIGDYEYYEKDKLGEGAFGSVYRGRQISTGLEIALKQIQTSRLREGELDAIVKAQSPFVVQFLDVVKTDQLTYIIMELCRTDLGGFLSQYGKLNETNLFTIGRSLAEGYMVLYRNGIVHRDIKPQNILLNVKSIEDDQQQPEIVSVKFTDFGCSRISRDGHEKACNLAGTFFYMAPEVGANVVENRIYDEQVDMWSMGIVLFQCMYGRVPFDERQLCRLFLHAIDGNDAGYEPPVPSEGPQVFRTVLKQLLKLNSNSRLKPIQFHVYFCHDHPSSFVKCLRQGSCSGDSANMKRSKQKGKMDTRKNGECKGEWKRRFSLESLPSIRRTASALLERLAAVCQKG